MNRKNIKTIAKKELQSLFNTPVAYLILVIFLALWQYLFFRNIFLAQTASLRFLFDLLPWLLLVLVPSLTMGSLSQEKTNHTLELLLTHPLTKLELILGKFLALTAFACLPLLFTLPLGLSLETAGNLDWGVILAQNLAAILLISLFTSLGIFFSSLFQNSIQSLLSTTAAAFILTIIGSEMVTNSLPRFLVLPFERLSTTSHFQSLTRGVLNLSDLFYFLSAAAVFLALTLLQLKKEQYNNRRDLLRQPRTTTVLIIGISLLVNLLGARLPGRLDLTQNRLFSLHPATKNILKNLDDVVTISLYSSPQLPSQLQPVLRETKDLLADYRSQSHNRLQILLKNTAKPEIAQEAREAGVQEAQFNVVSQEEFKVQKGFLGLAINYADQKEILPFIKSTADLEYQLSSSLKKLTQKDKKTLALTTGHSEKSLQTDYQYLNQELQKQFTTQNFDLTQPLENLASQPEALVIAGPQTDFSPAEIANFKTYLDNSGSALILLDTLNIDLQSLSAFPLSLTLADLLTDYGLSPQEDLVYDLKSNETINLGGGLFNYFLPYPFWLRALPAHSDLPLTEKITSLTLPWPSSLKLDPDLADQNGFTLTTLFETSQFGGLQTDNFTLNPEAELSQENLSQIPLVAILNKKDPQSQGPNRLALVADSDFLTNEFIANSPENLGFALEILSWLTQEESLAAIKLKQTTSRHLLFRSRLQPTLIKFANLGLALALPLSFGFFKLRRRRQQIQQKFKS